MTNCMIIIAGPKIRIQQDYATEVCWRTIRIVSKWI